MQCSRTSVINHFWHTPQVNQGCGRAYRIDPWKRPALGPENELGAGLDLDTQIMVHREGELALGGHLLMTLLMSHFMKRDIPQDAQDEGTGRLLPQKSALWFRFGTSPKGLCVKSLIHRVALWEMVEPLGGVA